MAPVQRDQQEDPGGPPRGQRHRPGPRRRLSKERIVDGAIRVIETDGLNALSMRRLADELAVAPGTLYTYVTNRTSLEVLILDTVSGWDELPHNLPGTWREKLASWARTDWHHFRERPWILNLRTNVQEFGPNMVRWSDSLLRVFDGFDVSEDIKLDIVGTLDAYIHGSVVAHLELVSADDQPATEMREAVGAAYNEASTLHRAITQAEQGRVFGTERFEFGLQCLLDGFESALHGKRA